MRAMKKYLFLILGLSAIIVTPVKALTGGPFDNGTFSSLTVAGGIFQATLSFKNGSGFVYFTPNNQLAPSTATTTAVGGFFSFGTSSTTVTPSELSIANRSIVYYKGFVFAGMATGEVDFAANSLNCEFNASSERGSTVSATNFGITANQTTTIVAGSGTNYVCNGTFDATITSQVPQPVFKGGGQIAFVSPDGFSASSQVISTVLQAAFSASNTALTTLATTYITNQIPTTISTTFQGPPVGGVLPPPTVVTNPAPPISAADQGVAGTASFQPGLNTILTGINLIQANATSTAATEASLLRAALTPPSLAAAAKNNEILKLTVTGNMRYF